jgi:mycofactocin precursor
MAETTDQAAETTAATEVTAEPAPPQPQKPETVVAELLVEDVSIDGMCGVY